MISIDCVMNACIPKFNYLLFIHPVNSVVQQTLCVFMHHYPINEVVHVYSMFYTRYKIIHVDFSQYVYLPEMDEFKSLYCTCIAFNTVPFSTLF